MLQMIKELPMLGSPKKLRIKFTKGGELIYISHLDLVRTLTRAIIRARIPVKYTEGYNPIPKLVFATPLSVGCASECEYLDIKIDREMSCEKIRESLAAQLPPDMSVVDVYEPERKFTDALYSSYVICIKDRSIVKDCAQLIDAAFSEREVVVRKRTKSGEKDVNILPYIKSIEVSAKDGEINIGTVLCCSSADYLNPEYIINIVYDRCSLSKENYDSECGYTITRKELYLSDLKTPFR